VGRGEPQGNRGFTVRGKIAAAVIQCFQLLQSADYRCPGIILAVFIGIPGYGGFIGGGQAFAVGRVVVVLPIYPVDVLLGGGAGA
jgi:hypothetical protein